MNYFICIIIIIFNIYFYIIDIKEEVPLDQTPPSMDYSEVWNEEKRKQISQSKQSDHVINKAKEALLYVDNTNPTVPGKSAYFLKIFFLLVNK